MAKNVFKSPNPTLEKAIQEALERAKNEQAPLDVMVKVLAAAIAWEKAKHAIMGGEESEFDPDED